MNKEKLNRIAYTLGYVLATILLVSATVVVIALVIKFLSWLF